MGSEAETVLEVRNLVKRFSGLVAVSDLSFQVKKRRKKRKYPTASQARKAGWVIKRFCDRRTADNACAGCPIRHMCETPPYTWDRKQGD